MKPFYRDHCPNAESGLNTFKGRVIDLRHDEAILHCNERYIRIHECPLDQFLRGDIVMMNCHRSGDLYRYEKHEILVRPATDPVGNTESMYERIAGKRNALEKRGIMLRTIRGFFDEHDFLEIQTPTLVVSPGLEPTLGFFSTVYVDESGKSNTYTLPTSPEFALKKILTAGYDRIYEIKPVFRNLGEYGTIHHPEFTMLEWYRSFADYTTIMSDVDELVGTVARALCPQMTSSFRGHVVSWEPPFKRISICDLWRSILNINLEETLSIPGELRRLCSTMISTPLHESEHNMDIFHRVMVEHIEPKLGHGKPVIIHDYPADGAALSVISKDNPAVCERFELYVGGIEIANAFTELNDPREMALRIRKDRVEQKRNGLPIMPADGELLRALRNGMPPSAGIAMGIDRLLMALLGIDSIHGCMAFSIHPERRDARTLSSLK